MAGMIRIKETLPSRVWSAATYSSCEPQYAIRRTEGAVRPKTPRPTQQL
jgi:hypothetical protein